MTRFVERTTRSGAGLKGRDTRKRRHDLDHILSERTIPLNLPFLYRPGAFMRDVQKYWTHHGDGPEPPTELAST